MEFGYQAFFRIEYRQLSNKVHALLRVLVAVFEKILTDTDSANCVQNFYKGLSSALKRKVDVPQRV